MLETFVCQTKFVQILYIIIYPAKNVKSLEKNVTYLFFLVLKEKQMLFILNMFENEMCRLV